MVRVRGDRILNLGTGHSGSFASLAFSKWTTGHRRRREGFLQGVSRVRETGDFSGSSSEGICPRRFTCPFGGAQETACKTPEHSGSAHFTVSLHLHLGSYGSRFTVRESGIGFQCEQATDRTRSRDSKHAGR